MKIAYLAVFMQCQLCLVLPLGKHRAHNWHSSTNAKCAICASPRVIPMTHRSLIMSCILSENGIFGSFHTMPIMPGITSGETQIAQLAFIKQCQICNLRFPKGNTRHNWHCLTPSKYAMFTQNTSRYLILVCHRYYPWGRTDCKFGIG